MEKQKHFTIIKSFAQKLPRNKYHSVQRIATFIIEENFSPAETRKYIKDYLAVSRMHLKFHERWGKLTNMKNIARYDRDEIKILGKLLRLI